MHILGKWKTIIKIHLRKAEKIRANSIPNLKEKKITKMRAGKKNTNIQFSEPRLKSLSNKTEKHMAKLIRKKER